MYEEVTVLTHSSIRIDGEKTIYFDPFKIQGDNKIASVIFITHEHYDHFSSEDIAKLRDENTILVIPASMSGQEAKAGFDASHTCLMTPGEEKVIAGLSVQAVYAYNKITKPFHTKGMKWLGYVVTMNQTRYYVAGDTDRNPDNCKVQCDVAILPIGGTYTMDAKEAAKLANELRPKIAIPSHYGNIVGSEKDAEVFFANLEEGIPYRK